MTSLLFNQNPENLQYNMKLLKKHLEKIIQNEIIEPFPVVKSRAQSDHEYMANKKLKLTSLLTLEGPISIIQNMLSKISNSKYKFCDLQQIKNPFIDFATPMNETLPDLQVLHRVKYENNIPIDYWVCSYWDTQHVYIYDHSPEKAYDDKYDFILKQLYPHYFNAGGKVKFPEVICHTRANNDSYIFAVANLIALHFNKKPEDMNYNLKAMRNHLKKIIKNETIEPFPVVKSNAERVRNYQNNKKTRPNLDHILSEGENIDNLYLGCENVMSRKTFIEYTHIQKFQQIVKKFFDYQFCTAQEILQRDLSSLQPLNDKKPYLDFFCTKSNKEYQHWVLLFYNEISITVYDPFHGQKLDFENDEILKRLFPQYDKSLLTTIYPKMTGDQKLPSAVYCIAYATSIIYKFRPEMIVYNVDELSSHWAKMVEQQVIEHFPFRFKPCPIDNRRYPYTEDTILGGERFNDQHINRFLQIVRGLTFYKPYDTFLMLKKNNQVARKNNKTKPIVSVPEKDHHIQILHGEDHWISYFYNGENIYVYDSSNQGTLSTDQINFLKLVHPYCFSPDRTHIFYPKVQLQMHGQDKNNIDCGAYAIAFAVSCLFAYDPKDIFYDRRQMRPMSLTLCKERRLQHFLSVYKEHHSLGGQFETLCCTINEQFSLIPLAKQNTGMTAVEEQMDVSVSERTEPPSQDTAEIHGSAGNRIFLQPHLYYKDDVLTKFRGAYLPLLEQKLREHNDASHERINNLHSRAEKILNYVIHHNKNLIQKVKGKLVSCQKIAQVALQRCQVVSRNHFPDFVEALGANHKQ